MKQNIFDKIMTLTKRRGFIYPSFEIYGGVAGFYDYGPLGTNLKNNIENLWRKYYLMKDNCVEINTPTITLYDVLKASGHVEEFTDLTIDCKKCKRSFKLEELVEKGDPKKVAEEGKLKCTNCGEILKNPYYVNLMFSTKIGIGNTRDGFLRPETAQGIFTNFHLLYRYAREKLPFGVVQIGKGYRNEISPRQGTIRLREFNMAEAEVFFDPKDKSHPDFNSIKDKTIYLFDNKKEMKLTVEKAVKQEIVNNQALAYYMFLTQDFLLAAGIDPKKFRFRKHSADELAHYAKECWDAEVLSEHFGWIECVGIADRSAYDLKSHIDSSGNEMYALRKFDESKIVNIKKIVADMGKLGPLFKSKAGKIKNILENIDIKDDKNIILNVDGEKIKLPNNCYTIVDAEEKLIGERFIPHVIEPSYGIDRILYMILEHSFSEGKKSDEEYRILKLNPVVAPIKVGIFPLISDRKLIDIAKKIDHDLRITNISTYYDEGGTIGRRYARMDEIGTPFCITVDHDTINDKSVTVRDRDTTKQVRIKIKKLNEFFEKKLFY
jgi:glycyl-tRNA synthetase